MTDTFLDYQDMLHDALRGVARQALRVAASQGLPGNHHFYLAFRTDYPGVGLSAILRDRYPEEMTIVLQHQFRDLEVTDEDFSVTLSFGGDFQRLTIPFKAMTVFSDPSVNFGLNFVVPVPQEDPPAEELSVPETAAGESNIISFEAARKNR